MSESTGLKRILVFDDDADFRALLKTYLSKMFDRVEVQEYDPVARGVPGEDFDWSRFDVLILDYYLCIHNITGLDILQANRRNKFFPATIMLTGAGSEEVAVRAVRAGVYDYLRKEKLDKEQLRKSILNAFEQHKEEQQRLNELTNQSMAFNKALFYQELESEDEDAKDRVLLLIQLDDDQTLEERLGAILRDNIVRHIAKRSFEVFQVGECHPHITRLGDSAVAMLIDQPESLKTLTFNMNGLCTHLKKRPYKFDDKKFRFTVSIGVVDVPKGRRSADRLIQLARQAAEVAAATEGNSFHILDTDAAIEALDVVEKPVAAATDSAPAAEPAPEAAPPAEPEISIDADLVSALDEIEEEFEEPPPLPPLEAEPPETAPVAEPVPPPSPAAPAPSAEPASQTAPEPAPEAAPAPAEPAPPQPEPEPETPQPEPEAAPALAPAPAPGKPALELTLEPELPARAPAPTPKPPAPPEPARAPAAPVGLSLEPQSPEVTPPPHRPADVLPGPAPAPARSVPAKPAATPAAKPAPAKSAAPGTPKPAPTAKPAAPAAKPATPAAKPATPAVKPAAPAAKPAAPAVKPAAPAARPAAAKPAAPATPAPAAKSAPAAKPAGVASPPAAAAAAAPAKPASDEIRLDPATLGEEALNISKAFDEKRVVQTFQPIISLVNEEGADVPEVFRVHLQLIDRSGSVKTEEAIYAAAGTPDFQKYIDRWLLRETIGRVVNNPHSEATFLIRISGASLEDPGLFNWLRKLLSGFDKRRPGQSIVLEMSAADYVNQQKKANALIAYLGKSQGFRFVLAQLREADEARLLVIAPTGIELLKVGHEMLKKLKATPAAAGMTGSLFDALEGKNVRIIVEDVEDATTLTDVISAGAHHAMGNFIGEATQHIEDSTNVESFEIT